MAAMVVSWEIIDNGIPMLVGNPYFNQCYIYSLRPVGHKQLIKQYY
jgi:hypothetical protein